MVKFRFMLIAILLVSASANMSAAWRIVFDRNCLKIVMANTASQKVDRKSTRLNSSHLKLSRMPSSA